jgi:hypothetical protein
MFETLPTTYRFVGVFSQFEKKKVDFQNSTAGQDERTPVDVLRDDAEQVKTTK